MLTRPQALRQLQENARLTLQQLEAEGGPVAGDPDSFTKAELDAAVKRYVASVQKVVDAFWKSSKQEVGTDNGPKYIRIWRARANMPAGSIPDRSALGFIDKTTGFLLKSEGWKKPAKGPRGDVFKDSAQPGGNGAIGGGHVVSIGHLKRNDEEAAMEVARHLFAQKRLDSASLQMLVQLQDDATELRVQLGHLLGTA